MSSKKTSATIIQLSTPEEILMADEWFELATPDHFWFEWRFQTLCDLMKGIVPGISILDLGCGNGVTKFQFEQYLNVPVDGCDLNMVAMGQGLETKGAYFFYNIHDRIESWKEKFDTIFMLDVLEHIEDPRSFLDSVSFHLKEEGNLLINVPCCPWLYCGYDERLGHVKRYTFDVLEKELFDSGFRVIEKQYWGFSILPALFMRKVLSRFFESEEVVKKGFLPPVFIDKIFRFQRSTERFFLKKPPIGFSLGVLCKKKEV